MKNKNTGFTLLEVIITIVVIGILVTLAIPSLVDAFAKSRDAEKLSNVQKLSRIIAIEEVHTKSSTYVYDLDGLKALAQLRGMSFPDSNSVYCYVYGYKPDSFFLAVRSEDNSNEFFADGTLDGRSDFSLETTLKTEMSSCSPLTNPTGTGGYSVLYLQ